MIDFQETEHSVKTIGERWKESVTNARVLAPYTATSVLRSAWCTRSFLDMQRAGPYWARVIVRKTQGR